MPETWCYWHFLCMFASSRLIALCTPNCKSLWIKASAKLLNVNVIVCLFMSSTFFFFREQNFSASLPSFPSPLTSVNTWLTRASQLNPSDCSYFYGNVFNYQAHRGCNVKTAYPGFISSQASIWLDLGAFVPCSTFPVSVWMTLTGSSLIWLLSSMSCTNK